uniref:Uncharacterized protein n=1 Tax=Anopheles minimus TaxID=112268 RepID=A0A182WPV0_9DIPT
MLFLRYGVLTLTDIVQIKFY